jgi:hypothetical protein
MLIALRYYALQYHILMTIFQRKLLLGGVELSPLFDLLYQFWMMMSVEQSVEWMTRETEVLGEICPSAALSTKNSIRPNPGSNPDRRVGKPATNRLSYAKELAYCIFKI